MTVEVLCPNCSASYHVSQEKLGCRVNCKKCSQSFVLESTVDNGHATQATEKIAPHDTGSSKVEKLGRFLIRDKLGAGAFGVVYRAYDPLLDREVALKVPHPSALASEKNKARYLREPKAAAQLRHPNIVPIFDAALEGDHFYLASAFIDGQTLQETFGKKRPDLRRAATLVMKLAGALSYAHQQGIVHRDVKSANIMLDAKNEPMLMDFGLARIQVSAKIHSDEVDAQRPPTSPAAAPELLTLDGTVMGTPAYMAPEQAAGKQDQIGAASDQYSLGVVLYELLCGERPFSGSAMSVISMVQNQQPPPPTKHNPAIPKDLESICAKAMSKNSDRRYASCQLLADDLRRWLDDEPIRARRIGYVERAYRWGKNNPLPAGLAASSATLLLLVAVISFVAYTKTSAALSHTEMQKQIAENQRKVAQQETQEAEKQRRIAKEETKRADEEAGRAQRRFNETRRLANVVLNEIHDAIADLPGSTPARELLVKTGLEYLDGLAKEVGDDLVLQRELLVGYSRVGDVSGNPNYNHLGRTAEALASYQKGLEIAQRLAQADPENTRAQWDLSVSYNNIGNMQAVMGKTTDALASYKKMLGIAQRVAEVDQANARAQRDVSYGYDRVGNMQAVMGKTNDALASYREGLEIRRRLAQAYPEFVDPQRDLSVSYNNIGKMQVATDKLDDALASYQKGLDISLRLAKADPTSTEAQRDLSVSYSRIGDIQASTGKTSEALASYQQSLEISLRLAKTYPESARAQQDLSTSYKYVGDLQSATGKTADALASYQKGLEITQRLAQADPERARTQNDLWDLYGSLAFSHRSLAGADLPSPQRLKHWQEALAYYRKAEGHIREIKKRGLFAPADEPLLDKITAGIKECNEAIEELK